MADATKILKLLVNHAGALLLDDIAKATAEPSGASARHRKKTVASLGRLMQRKLVARVAKATTVFPANAQPAYYEATRAGRDLIAAGGRVTSGANGPRTGLPSRPANMRTRIWEALRLKKKATIQQLVELVHHEGDPDPVKVTENARRYLTALKRAGVVTLMATRAAGFAPSSNGFHRYALVRDLGLLAPLAGKDFVTDPNARMRIDYRKES